MANFIVLILLLCSCSKEINNIIEVTGTIEVKEADISAVISDRIQRVLVEEGDYVNKGAILVSLEKDAYRLQIEQSEGQLSAIEKNLESLRINYKNAEKNYLRMSDMKKSLALGEAQFDVAATQRDMLHSQIQGVEQQIRSARAVVDLAKKQLAETDINSPLDGVVLHRYVEEGEIVAQGFPILTIGDLARPWVRTYIPEKYLGRVKLGQKAEIYSDSFPEKVYAGKVAYISSKEEFTPKNLVTKEERTKMVYRIKISVENSENELKPGLYVDVRIPLND
ncbi:MAG TPA: efflux RND transporter periplasmic adaptor subunit [bacterium]